MSSINTRESSVSALLSTTNNVKSSFAKQAQAIVFAITSAIAAAGCGPVRPAECDAQPPVTLLGQASETLAGPNTVKQQVQVANLDPKCFRAPLKAQFKGDFLLTIDGSRDQVNEETAIGNPTVLYSNELVTLAGAPRITFAPPNMSQGQVVGATLVDTFVVGEDALGNGFRSETVNNEAAAAGHM